MKAEAARSWPAGLRWRATVRVIVGLVLLVAGIGKVAQPGVFHASLLTYELGGPDELYRWAAALFPWLEVFCGGLLAAGWGGETVGAMAAGLALLFVLLLGQAVLRGLDLTCGCFGGLAPAWFDRPLPALARACALLLAACWGWIPATPGESSHLRPHDSTT